MTDTDPPPPRPPRRPRPPAEPEPTLLPGEDPADLARLRRLDERFGSRTTPAEPPPPARPTPKPPTRPSARPAAPRAAAPRADRAPDERAPADGKAATRRPAVQPGPPPKKAAEPKASADAKPKAPKVSASKPASKPKTPKPTSARTKAAPRASGEHRGTPLQLIAVVLIAVLLVGELGVRVIANHLPAHTGPEQEIVVKADQIKHLEATKQQPDVVFLGPSTMDAGLNTTTFDQNSKRFKTSYNAAMKGMTQSLTQRWATRTVLHHLHPKVVVVNVQPTLLVSPKGAAIAEAQRVVTSYNYYLRQVEDAPLTRADKSLSDVSQLFKYRADLQSPSNVYNAVKGTIEGARLATVNPEDTLGFARRTIAPGGQNQQYAQAPDAVLPDPGMAQAFKKALSDNIELGDTETLLRALQAKGFQVVVVVMPIDMRSLVPMGLDPATFHPAIDALVRMDNKLNIPSLDYSELALDPLEFHDKVHLAAQGAKDFSTHLANDLDGLCDKGQLKACKG